MSGRANALRSSKPYICCFCARHATGLEAQGTTVPTRTRRNRYNGRRHVSTTRNLSSQSSAAAVSHDDGSDLPTEDVHLSTGKPEKPRPPPFTLPPSSKWARPTSTTAATPSTLGLPSGLALGKWARIPPKSAVPIQHPTPSLLAAAAPIDSPTTNLEAQRQPNGPSNQPVPAPITPNLNQSEIQSIHAESNDLSSTKEELGVETQANPQSRVDPSTSQTVPGIPEEIRLAKPIPKLFDPTKRPIVPRKSPILSTTGSPTTPAIPSLTPQGQKASDVQSILLGKWALPIPKPEPVIQASPVSAIPKDVRPNDLDKKGEPVHRTAPSVAANPALKLFSALSKPALDKWKLSDETTSRPSAEVFRPQFSAKSLVQTSVPVQQQGATQLNAKDAIIAQHINPQVDQQNMSIDKAPQIKTSVPSASIPQTSGDQVPDSIAPISNATTPVNQAPASANDQSMKMAAIEKMLEDVRRKSYEEAGLVYPGPAAAPATVSPQPVPTHVTAISPIPTRPPVQAQTGQASVSAPHISTPATITLVAPSVSPTPVKPTISSMQNTPKIDIAAGRTIQTQPSTPTPMPPQMQFGSVEALLNRYSKKPPNPLPMNLGQTDAQIPIPRSTAQSEAELNTLNHFVTSVYQRQAVPYTANQPASTPLSPLANDTKLSGFDLPPAPPALQRPKLFEARMPEIVERKPDPPSLTRNTEDSFRTPSSSASRSFMPAPPKPTPTLSASALDKWARPSSLKTDAIAPKAVSFLDIAPIAPETPQPPPEAVRQAPRITRSDDVKSSSAWTSSDNNSQQVSWGQGGRARQSSTGWSQGGPNAQDRAQYAASNFGISPQSSQFNVLDNSLSDWEAFDSSQAAWQIRDPDDEFKPRVRQSELDPNFLPTSAEAEYLQEEGRKKKKRLVQAVPEDNEWARKKSGKERDKMRHGREFVEGNFEAIETEEGGESKAERKARRKREKEAAYFDVPDIVPIYLPEFISISRLAQQLKIHLDRFTRRLEEMGFTELSPDFVLDAENAGLIAMEYNYDPIIVRDENEDLVARPKPEDMSIYPPRPPVVTIMGHVDHGKTTLLDWLRKSHVVDQEHGGITQHIGAFSVKMPSGKQITFLDTPGHAAFLSMRERGANVTDIVILVVAADDGVMPQTKEAIRHAQAAKVPIIVAVNKCDKESADIRRVKLDLAMNGIEIEDDGGDTQVIPVSGKTGLGMEDLEEATVLQSEILDMRADKEGACEGWIIEATTKLKGRVATVLVRSGTLRKGDILVAGKTWTRVRTLLSDSGEELDFALPGTPVEVDGWREQPEAGDEVLQAPTEARAKTAIEYRIVKEERIRATADMEAINKARLAKREADERAEREAELLAQGLEPEKADEDETPKYTEVPFIIKGDVSGSVEAVTESVMSIGNEEVRSKVIRAGVGALTRGDIEMAYSTGAHCLTFNCDSEDQEVEAMARMHRVKIYSHNIIYKLQEDVSNILSALLSPIITKTVTGEAEILQVFQINTKGKQYTAVAGCIVKNMVITRNSKCRVMRNKEVVYDGSISTLKNVKKDVKEMGKDRECGISFANWSDFQPGDTIQCYDENSTPRRL